MASSPSPFTQNRPSLQLMVVLLIIGMRHAQFDQFKAGKGISVLAVTTAVPLGPAVGMAVDMFMRQQTVLRLLATECSTQIAALANPAQAQ